MELAQTSLLDILGNVVAWAALVVSVVSAALVWRNSRIAEDAMKAARDSAAIARDALALNKSVFEKAQGERLRKIQESEIDALEGLHSATTEFSAQLADYTNSLAWAGDDDETVHQRAVKLTGARDRLVDVLRRSVTKIGDEPRVRTELTVLVRLIASLIDRLDGSCSLETTFQTFAAEYRESSDRFQQVVLNALLTKRGLPTAFEVD